MIGLVIFYIIGVAPEKKFVFENCLDTRFVFDDSRPTIH